MPAIRAGRPDNFGDVDITAGVQANIVRGEEISGSGWIQTATPATQ